MQTRRKGWIVKTNAGPALERAKTLTGLDRWKQNPLVETSQRLLRNLERGASPALIEAAIRRWHRLEIRDASDVEKAKLDLYALYGNHLWVVRNWYLPNFARTYFPPSYISQFVTDGLLLPNVPAKKPRQYGRTDPVELVRVALSGCPNGGYAAFAAARDLALAHYSLSHMYSYSHSDICNGLWWDSLARANRFRTKLVDTLQYQRLIIDKPIPVTLRPVLENNYPFHCIGAKVQSRLFGPNTDLPLPMPTFFERDGPLSELDRTQPGKSSSPSLARDYLMIRIRLPAPKGSCDDEFIPALLKLRQKGFIQAVCKAAETELRSTLHLNDLIGARFCYASLEDMAKAGLYLKSVIGDGFGDTKSHIHLSPDDAPVNRYAARNLLLVAHGARLSGQSIEVQHMTLKQDLDLQFSHGLENTLLYHTRRHTGPNGWYERLFPGPVYGEEAVRQDLADHILANTPR